MGFFAGGEGVGTVSKSPQPQQADDGLVGMYDEPIIVRQQDGIRAPGFCTTVVDPLIPGIKKPEDMNAWDHIAGALGRVGDMAKWATDKIASVDEDLSYMATMAGTDNIDSDILHWTARAELGLAAYGTHNLLFAQKNPFLKGVPDHRYIPAAGQLRVFLEQRKDILLSFALLALAEGVDVEHFVPWFEKKTGMTLDDSERQLLQVALTPISIAISLYIVNVSYGKFFSGPNPAKVSALYNELLVLRDKIPMSARLPFANRFGGIDDVTRQNIERVHAIRRELTTLERVSPRSQAFFIGLFFAVNSYSRLASDQQAGLSMVDGQGAYAGFNPVNWKSEYINLPLWEKGFTGWAKIAGLWTISADVGNGIGHSLHKSVLTPTWYSAGLSGGGIPRVLWESGRRYFGAADAFSAEGVLAAEQRAGLYGVLEDQWVLHAARDRGLLGILQNRLRSNGIDKATFDRLSARLPELSLAEAEQLLIDEAGVTPKQLKMAKVKAAMRAKLAPAIRELRNMGLFVEENGGTVAAASSPAAQFWIQDAKQRGILNARLQYIGEIQKAGMIDVETAARMRVAAEQEMFFALAPRYQLERIAELEASGAVSADAAIKMRMALSEGAEGVFMGQAQEAWIRRSVMHGAMAADEAAAMLADLQKGSALDIQKVVNARSLQQLELVGAVTASDATVIRQAMQAQSWGEVSRFVQASVVGELQTQGVLSPERAQMIEAGLRAGDAAAVRSIVKVQWIEDMAKRGTLSAEAAEAMMVAVRQGAGVAGESATILRSALAQQHVSAVVGADAAAALRARAETGGVAAFAKELDAVIAEAEAASAAAGKSLRASQTRLAASEQAMAGRSAFLRSAASVLEWRRLGSLAAVNFGFGLVASGVASRLQTGKEGFNQDEHTKHRSATRGVFSRLLNTAITSPATSASGAALSNWGYFAPGMLAVIPAYDYCNKMQPAPVKFVEDGLRRYALTKDSLERATDPQEKARLQLSLHELARAMRTIEAHMPEATSGPELKKIGAMLDAAGVPKLKVEKQLPENQHGSLEMPEGITPLVNGGVLVFADPADHFEPTFDASVDDILSDITPEDMEDFVNEIMNDMSMQGVADQRE